jgi:hypothetical protein
MKEAIICASMCSLPLNFIPLQIILPFQTCNLLRGGYILLQQVTLPGQPINMEH